ncbi:MAG TPA: glycosyltransferase [Rhizomicrobium sp.]|jgi:hopene-associated glycosyltransferase HpnB
MIWLATLPLLVWMYLLSARGLFWLMRKRDDRDLPSGAPGTWPSVTAIVPARDEADVIACATESLLAQDYPGDFRIVLVDDRSSDGTTQIARRAALACGSGERMEIVSGQERPGGWTGKVWAMRQGVARALDMRAPDYLLITDADIAHSPDNLRRLVMVAEARRLVLVSQMAKLHCDGFAEKLLIPAFVFFFAMLFPFAWVSDRARRTAAAAGGCMLVRRDALLAAGGVERIADDIIDDCALARLLKPHGPIWLGLTERAVSIRPYGGLAGIGAMVARSAYAQLGYSFVLLCGTVAGMLIIYAAPPLLTIFGPGPARVAGAVAWLLMAVSLQPILRFYRLSPAWGFLLPLTGLCYAVFTVQSAMQCWRGRGGMWKGRAQAMA